MQIWCRIIGTSYVIRLWTYMFNVIFVYYLSMQMLRKLIRCNYWCHTFDFFKIQSFFLLLFNYTYFGKHMQDKAATDQELHTHISSFNVNSNETAYRMWRVVWDYDSERAYRLILTQYWYSWFIQPFNVESVLKKQSLS